jgi:hypothetical protein
VKVYSTMKLCVSTIKFFQQITRVPICENKNFVICLIRDYLTAQHKPVNIFELTEVTSLHRTPQIVGWLKSKGYNVTFWKHYDPDNAYNMVWGIEIADNCPKFMEYVLKSI